LAITTQLLLSSVKNCTPNMQMIHAIIADEAKTTYELELKFIYDIKA